MPGFRIGLPVERVPKVRWRYAIASRAALRATSLICQGEIPTKIALVKTVKFIRNRACIGPTANSNKNTGQEHVEPPWVTNFECCLGCFVQLSGAFVSVVSQCNMPSCMQKLNCQSLHIIYSVLSHIIAIISHIDHKTPLLFRIFMVIRGNGSRDKAYRTATNTGMLPPIFVPVSVKIRVSRHPVTKFPP